MVTIEVACKYCSLTYPVRKHGFGRAGFPRYFCMACQKSFQLNYRYNAYKHGAKENILGMSVNGNSLRATARELKVGVNTVIRTVKKSKK